MAQYRRCTPALLLCVGFVIMSALVTTTRSTHFRGGTISWEPLGGTKARFLFKLGWTYGRGPGCTSATIGKLATGLTGSQWTCNGCSKNRGRVANLDYYCTRVNRKANWEQGENSFIVNFPSAGVYHISFYEGSWLALSNGKGKDYWNIATSVDLRTRSDIGAINSSPKTSHKPEYSVQFGCESEIHIPVVDPNGDVIRCRWARGHECESVCDSLPGAVLNEETCTITFNATAAAGYISSGIYAAALTIEDFPKEPINVGNSKKTPSDALSAIPLQFLIKTVGHGSACSSRPRFLPPTPAMNEFIDVEEGHAAVVTLFADNNNDTVATANLISASGPANMTSSSVTLDPRRKDVYTMTLTLPTNPGELGDHIVCADVENSIGKSGAQRCFTISVVPRGCICKNGGHCVKTGTSYSCKCTHGFMGAYCEILIPTPSSSSSSSPAPAPAKSHPKTNTTVEEDHKNTTCTTSTTNEHQNQNGGLLPWKPTTRDLISFFIGFPIGALFTAIVCYCYGFRISPSPVKTLKTTRVQPIKVHPGTKSRY